MFTHLISYGLVFFYYGLFFIAVFATYQSKGDQWAVVLAAGTQPGILFSRMLAGIFFLGMGITSLLMCNRLHISIFDPGISIQPVWGWLSITLIVLVIGGTAGYKKINPLHRLDCELPFSLLFIYFLVRILFLIVYEFFFRGAVLFMMQENIGIKAAVAINIVLYMLIHWHHKNERYGSLLLGTALCLLSLYYGSVWPAVIIHLAIALSNEIALLLCNYSLLKKSGI